MEAAANQLVGIFYKFLLVLL